MVRCGNDRLKRNRRDDKAQYEGVTHRVASVPRVAASERLPERASSERTSERACGAAGGGGVSSRLYFRSSARLKRKRARSSGRASERTYRALSRDFPCRRLACAMLAAVTAPDDADAGAAPAADLNVGDTLDVLKISHGTLRIMPLRGMALCASHGQVMTQAVAQDAPIRPRARPRLW